MSRSGKVIVALLALPLLVLAALGAFLAKFPEVSPPADLEVRATPELLARGKYLAENVATCMDCHSTRDFSQFAGPVVPGTLGKGGERYGEEMGLPGTLYASNLTPSALGQWTDGELARAITSGVSRDGTALFPLMPYGDYRQLCERDLEAIIAYLRALSPIENQIPERKLNFPLNLLVRTMPAAATPGPCPDPGNKVEHGRYLTTLAGCESCHTLQERGKPVAGMELAGGFAFPLPKGGTVKSTNITPDVETGIGGWSREQFIARFREYAEAKERAVEDGQFNTVMPWTLFGRMSEEDLGAIYDYLRTRKAVSHKVERFTPPHASVVVGSSR